MSKIEDIEASIAADETALARYEADLVTIRGGGKVENMTEEGALRVIAGMRAALANRRALLTKLRAAKLREVFDKAIEATDDPNLADQRRLLREFFTNDAFRQAMTDEIARINGVD